LPKVEDYDDHLFIVTHAVDYSRADKFNTSELNLFLGKDYLVSFHRKSLRSVQGASDRCLKNPAGVARSADRLAHLLLDQLADNYRPVIDDLRTEIEAIEDSVLEKSHADLTPDLLACKAEIAHLRQIVRPLRDVINRLAHGDTRLIRAATLPYFRDVRDNLIRLDETAASYADRLLISFDLYLSKSAFEANEGIKVLTSLTAITLPATIIATWYGMNFEHMPELKSPHGYAVTCLVTLGFTIAMWIWCKRKKWI
jgi:magnesium transporter